MIAALRSKLAWAAGLLIAFFGIVLGAIGIGRRQGRAETAAARDLAEARGYQKTMGDAFNAPHHTDPDAARERMRTRDPRQP